MTRTTDRVGFLVDDASLPNIVTQLRLLGAELEPTYTLDLFYHESVDPALEPRYTTHRVPVERVTPLSTPVSEILARVAAYSAAGRRYVSAHSPVAVVGFTNPPVLGTAAGVAALGTDTQAVYRYSGDSFNEYRQLRGASKLLGVCHYNGIGRLALRLCDTYVVLGDHGRTQLTDRAVPDDRIYTVPPAVDRERFSPGESSVPHAAETLGLFVGRLTERKGADRLERIVDRVLEATDDVEFVVVGDGPYRERIDRLSDGRVHAVGRRPHEELPAYYRAADFLVHPSRLEGLPNVLLEAKASGVYTITTSAGELAAYADRTCEDVSEFVTAILALPAHQSDSEPGAVLTDAESVGRAFRVMLRE